MKIAFWNIENLYNRDKDLDRANWNKCLFDWVNELDRLMGRIQKGPNDVDRIRELTFLLGFEKINDHPYGTLRKRQGELYLKPGSFAREIRAAESTDYTGWIPLTTRGIHQNSIRNKAKLIGDIDADVLILQEVEDRASLLDFNELYLMEYMKKPYDQILVLEGTDSKGLSMGIMVKNGYRIDTLKCHTSLNFVGEIPIFGSECHEYALTAPQGETFHILSAQFSKEDPVRRKQEARKVAGIYDQMVCDGKENILVCGTLNDVSYSDTLSPLLAGTDLVDISRNRTFRPKSDKGRDARYFSLGAYSKGVNIKQRDYMLLSYSMADKVIASGLDRRAMWPERTGKWDVYPSVTSREHAGSSHPLIWGEWDIKKRATN